MVSLLDILNKKKRGGNLSELPTRISHPKSRRAKPATQIENMIRGREGMNVLRKRT